MSLAVSGQALGVLEEKPQEHDRKGIEAEKEQRVQ